MLKGLYKLAKKELSELGNEVSKDVSNIDGQKILKNAKKLGRQSLGTIVYGVYNVVEGKPAKGYKEMMNDLADDDYFKK